MKIALKYEDFSPPSRYFNHLFAILCREIFPILFGGPYRRNYGNYIPSCLLSNYPASIRTYVARTVLPTYHLDSSWEMNF